MGKQASLKPLDLSQTASNRDTLIDFNAVVEEAAFKSKALVASPSQPLALTSPLSEPAMRAANDRGTVPSSQTPTKRSLPSVGEGRVAKTIKTASATDRHHAAQDAQPRGQVGARAGPGTRHTAKMRAENPWARYRKVYEIMIDGFVTAAIRRDRSSEPVIVRSFREDGTPAAKTKKLHEIRHENLLALLESFSFEGYRHLILQRVSISLVEVVACPHYPTVHELVAILKQIVAGLCFLETQGIVHGSLDCSNVLLTAEGVIKISGHECPRQVDSSPAHDVIAVGYIAMNLMQKAPQENRHIGLEHPERWPDDAQLFLPATTSITSAKALSEERLLSRPCEPARLKWIYDLSRDTVTRLFKYSA